MTDLQKLKNGTGIIGKGTVEKNFEIVSMEIYNYIELELISFTDMGVYIKLLQLYNADYGYAFPTISQLMKYTAIGSKATIHQSLDTLEEVGLLKKSKSRGKNNVYIVYKPFDKEELYKLVPGKVKKLKENNEKADKTNKAEKIRFQQHKQTAQKPLENPPAQLEETDLLPEEIAMLKKMEKLHQFNN